MDAFRFMRAKPGASLRSWRPISRMSRTRAHLTRDTHQPNMNTPLTYRSPKTEIRDSQIHGRGLFARARIRDGEVVAAKGGHVMTAEMWQVIEPDLGSAEIQIDERLFIGPVTAEERDAAMIFTNHSCEPNIAIQGQIIFVAMRDIDAGEELTHDWATTDAGDYKMQCNCHSRSCRGTITGNDWLRPELQQKYQGWFCWFLQKRIDEAMTSRTP
jgi:hypothetical protein